MGHLGSIPGLGRSPGEGEGYPLQCSCLENSTDYMGLKSQTNEKNVACDESLDTAQRFQDCWPGRQATEYSGTHSWVRMPGPSGV